jgi:hypothetical protein
MKETLKNFFAIVIATIIWGLAFSILIGIYLLFESGPNVEEFVFLGVVSTLFTIGVYASRKNDRLKTALDFPLFPGI